MEKLLPILSSSLRQFLNDLTLKNKNQIAEDLL
jgi:hypothetical protein